MKLRHKLTVGIVDHSGDRHVVMRSVRMRIPKKLITWLLGDFCEVLVLTPGKTVDEVEIREMRGSNE